MNAGGSMVEDQDAVEFKQFRLKLLGFLRLPVAVSETQLRDALRSISENVLVTYLKRAKGMQQPIPIKNPQAIELD